MRQCIDVKRFVRYGSSALSLMLTLFLNQNGIKNNEFATD